ncbi:hypothetical protein [Vreelandella janggokensis]|uniref:Uncharacterized protein n=1 Tax=Vreelandella janggokensis TaxID=370767 RepID=A0ABT4IWZ2_9GAMM|nr:hypothetical protein [Halomonas janggokensis]MCZ0928199.1 hypothetical protein [Halomonas janggokensis]
MFVDIRKRFTCKCLYAVKRLSAVIRKPGKTGEISAQANKLLIFLRPKNTEGVIAVIYHHFYASRVK